MTSPSLELQGAIVAVLKADAEVAAIVGTRVYDMVPPNGVPPAFPYVALSGWQELDAGADCINGAEITVTIDTWSRASGTPETHRLTDAVRWALHDAELTLTDNALAMIEHENTLTMRDPDGITTHGVLDFRALVEQP